VVTSSTKARPNIPACRLGLTPIRDAILSGQFLESGERHHLITVRTNSSYWKVTIRALRKDLQEGHIPNIGAGYGGSSSS